MDAGLARCRLGQISGQSQTTEAHGRERVERKSPSVSATQAFWVSQLAADFETRSLRGQTTPADGGGLGELETQRQIVAVGAASETTKCRAVGGLGAWSQRSENDSGRVGR